MPPAAYSAWARAASLAACRLPLAACRYPLPHAAIRSRTSTAFRASITITAHDTPRSRGAQHPHGLGEPWAHVVQRTGPRRREHIKICEPRTPAVAGRRVGIAPHIRRRHLAAPAALKQVLELHVRPRRHEASRCSPATAASATRSTRTSRSTSPRAASSSAPRTARADDSRELPTAAAYPSRRLAERPVTAPRVAGISTRCLSGRRTCRPILYGVPSAERLRARAERTTPSPRALRGGHRTWPTRCSNAYQT